MFDVFFILSVVGATMNSLKFSVPIQHVIFFLTEQTQAPFHLTTCNMFNAKRLIVLCVLGVASENMQ